MSSVDTNSRYELISLETHREWYLVQFAVNGTLTQSFWEHKSVHERYPTEDLFMAHLRSRADAMLDQFGDLRTLGPLEVIDLGKVA